MLDDTSRLEKILISEINANKKYIEDVGETNNYTLEKLYKQVTILANLSEIKKNKQQEEVTNVLNKSLHNLDMSKIDLSVIKNIFKPLK